MNTTTENPIKKACTQCLRNFPETLQYFGPNKKGKNGLHSFCRVCTRASDQRRTLLKRTKSRTPEYKAWISMIERCEKPTCPCYHHYGGRGITVCERWHSFDLFLKDMGARPSRGHSIERLNNNGNYEPSNCKWATAKEQSRNRRSNSLLTLNGETKCITDWAITLEIPPTTIWSRLAHGWSVERTLTVTRKPPTPPLA
jgi:hypothetical protein